MVASPVPPILLACPRCGTRYQLPAEAIGPRGRKVTCAHCRQTWHAEGMHGLPPVSEPDELFDDDAETELDRAFAEAGGQTDPDPADPREEKRRQTVEEIRKVVAPPPDDQQLAARRSARSAHDRRLAALGRQLPLARLRRGARLMTVSLLLTLLAAAIAFRTEIVRQFPALADAYATIGIPVNVVGLEFRDIRTATLVRNGVEVMRVDARIYSVATRRVLVPAVLVTLLDHEGQSLYEWSVKPDYHDLEPGELLDLTTQLTAPPSGAARVRLTFVSDTRTATAPTPRSEASI